MQISLDPEDAVILAELEDVIGKPLARFEEDASIGLFGIPFMGFHLEGYAVQGNKITRLWVSSQNLQEIPVSIGRLQALRELTLPRNLLTSYPEELCDLPNLEILDLTCNRLAYLPKVLGNLHSLKILLAGHNEIEELPVTLEFLQNLQGLFLQENRISQLPAEIANMRNLRLLHLENNQLWCLPEWLANLNAFVVIAGNLTIEGTLVTSDAISKPLAGAQIQCCLGYDTSQLPSYRDAAFKVIHQIKNIGMVPLDSISYYQVISEHYQIPEQSRIQCFLARGTNQNIKNLSHAQIDAGSNKLQIRVENIMEDATLGAFLPGDCIILVVPFTSIKPEPKDTFTSEVLYQASSKSLNVALECEAETVQIPVFHGRRKYDKGKEVRSLDAKAGFEITLFLQNRGQGTLENVIVTDKVPANYRHYNYSEEPAIQNLEEEDLLSWRVPVLEPGQHWEAHFRICGEGDFRPKETQFSL
jgi:hypothetical protein